MCLSESHACIVLPSPHAATCRSSKRWVDPFCSHAGGDQREQRRRRGARGTAPGCLNHTHQWNAMLKGPPNTSPCFDVWKRCDDNMTGGNRTEKWKSHDILWLLIWKSLPSQLAGPSPVFLGVTCATRPSTSDTNIKPHSRMQTSRPVFKQMP